ncbi:MFS transporter [Aneurinibacillus terranovensis]|uniref:MFS transporter n=1 Tax=Aneurinibacillus terranovensis TaxID=278991 RepID=UPI0003FE1F75|nr:MFS transporter [Aneurinibacillus terranovensis]
MSYIKQGTSAFRKTNLALFAGGFSTFANLYCVQPLLPEFSREFHISPTAASLSLSVTTIALAISMLLIGSLSESWGRKPIMAFSMFAVSVLAILTAFVPDFHFLLVSRILQGVVFAGLPSIAMAYLGEEIDPTSLGVAMGMYISGNTIGGLGGRIIVGMLTDFFNWRVAIASIGVLSIVASLLFWLTLPSSQNFQPRTLEWGKLIKSMISHLKDPGLLCLYGIGFLLMGSFVTLYNYIGFQLIAPPYSLNQTLAGWIFIVYIVGTFSSTWMGSLADKYGRRKVLWISLLIMFLGAGTTLNTNLLIKIIGIAVFTFGFFGGHSIASSWVGRRATHDKAQASSLYLFFYYVGSSVGGTAGGAFWTAFGWDGVVSMIICFLVLALILSVFLSKIAPVVVHKTKNAFVKA